MTIEQQQADEERRRREDEKPWLDMTHGEIISFLHFNPTYFMGPKEASDWWAGVDRLIQRDRAAWNCGPDYYMSGRNLRHRGSTGDNHVHTFDSQGKDK